MAFELLTEVPNLLREGHIMHFSEKWDDKWAKKYFRVELAQQMQYDVHKIVPPGTAAPSQQDLSFSAPAGGGVTHTRLSLLPESNSTVYEMLFGFKGLVLLFPRYNDKYFLELETTGVHPDLTNSMLRFLGYYSQTHSPYYAPKLREFTVKDQAPPVLRLFNPMITDEMLDITIIVNRCKVETVAEAALTEQERRVAREIRHFSIFIW